MLNSRLAVVPLENENALKGAIAKFKHQTSGRRAALRSNVDVLGMQQAKHFKVPVKTQPAFAKPSNVSMKQTQPAPVKPAVQPCPPKAPSPKNVSMKEEQLCQAFSEVMIHVDIDAEDEEDPRLCRTYVKDIYLYLRQLEVQQPVFPRYLQAGGEINSRMRALLVNWLILVHDKFLLLQETLYMAIALTDRFLQVQQISRNKLQLVGVAALHLAAKYEEVFVPEVGDFIYMTDDAYSNSQFLDMQMLILRRLDFNLGRPVPLHFLRRASKASRATLFQHTLAKYLMELTLTDYDMVHFRPSEIAAAALCLTQKILEEGEWDAVTQHYTGYTEEDLLVVMKHMAKNVFYVNNNLTQNTAAMNKYACSKRMRSSTIPQLNGKVIEDLSASLMTRS